MEINYSKWLEVKINNGYFKDSVCSVLKIIPFEKTAEKLHNYNVLFRKSDNIISFYCGTYSENFDVTTELSGLKELYFQVLTDDPMFANYTEIPAVVIPEIFLFQNSKNSSLLQMQKYVTSKELITPVQSGLPNITIPSGAIIEVKDKQGDVIQKQSNTEENFNPINIENLETGTYQIWINGSLEKNFTHFNTSIAENCLGVLKLNLNLGVNTATKVPTLTLDFKSRDVFSQYLIITPDTWDKEKTTIQIEGSRGETYPNPVPKLLQKIGKKTAQVITSDIAIPLTEDLPTNPTLKINYANTFSNMMNQLEVKLPNSGVENLKIITNEQGDSSFCSTTIVYV